MSRNPDDQTRLLEGAVLIPEAVARNAAISRLAQDREQAGKDAAADVLAIPLKWAGYSLAVAAVGEATGFVALPIVACISANIWNLMICYGNCCCVCSNDSSSDVGPLPPHQGDPGDPDPSTYHSCTDGWAATGKNPCDSKGNFCPTMCDDFQLFGFNPYGADAMSTLIWSAVAGGSLGTAICLYKCTVETAKQSRNINSSCNRVVTSEHKMKAIDPEFTHSCLYGASRLFVAERCGMTTASASTTARRSVTAMK